MTTINIQIEEVDFPTTSDEIIESYIDYSVKEHQRKNPRDPPLSREPIRKSLRRDWPFGDNFNWLVWNRDDDTVIGAGGIGYDNEKSPSYESNKHVAWGGCNVDYDYRRKGIGSQLINLIVKKFLETDREIFQSGTDDPDGMAFLQKLGVGKIALEGAENRLYLEDIDWDNMARWIKEGKERAPDVKLKFIQGDIPEEILDDYLEFYTDALNSIPKEEMEWDANLNRETQREQEARMKERGTDAYILLSIEADGSISGVTDMYYTRDNPHWINQGLTAVLPQYRGRGLGKWLKAEMACFIRDNLEELLFIRTDNANVNAPMLSINTRMGFQTYRENQLYKFNRTEMQQIVKR